MVMFVHPCKGICGRTRIADVGGPPYLVPLPDLSKVKNEKLINSLIKINDVY